MKNLKLKKMLSLIVGIGIALSNTPLIQAVGTPIVETEAGKQLWTWIRSNFPIHRLTYINHYTKALGKGKELFHNVTEDAIKFMDKKDKTHMSYFIARAEKLLHEAKHEVMPLIKDICKQEEYNKSSDLYQLHKALDEFFTILHEKLDAIIQAANNSKYLKLPRKNSLRFALSIKKPAYDLISTETLRTLKSKIDTARNAWANISGKSTEEFDKLYALLTKWETEEIDLIGAANEFYPILHHHL